MLEFFFLLIFQDRVSLCSPGCPGTHSVDQAGLKLRNPPASASRVLGLKACTFFKIKLFGSLEANFLSSLYILDISPRSDVGLIKIFSQSLSFLFAIFTMYFALQKICNFMRSHLSILDLRA